MFVWYVVVYAVGREVVVRSKASRVKEVEASGCSKGGRKKTGLKNRVNGVKKAVAVEEIDANPRSR